jgi:hypothetical protein
MLPPSSHFLYIPAVLLLGVILGFILGARAARDQANLAVKRDADRAKARADRAARRAAKAAPGGDDGDDDDGGGAPGAA